MIQPQNKRRSNTTSAILYDQDGNPIEVSLVNGEYALKVQSEDRTIESLLEELIDAVNEIKLKLE